MDVYKPQSSKLFVYTSVDIKDDFEERYERAYQNYAHITNGLNDKELHEMLSTYMSKDKQHEEKISIGFIYAILTDPQEAPKTYRDLTLLTRDGLQFVTQNLNILVADKYQKLTEIAKKQILWIMKEFIKNAVLNADNIVWYLLRQASGGDISPKNLFLVESLLDIFIEYREWLEKNPILVGVVVYTYVRLIEDHATPMLNPLRAKEVKFIVQLIRDRFADVVPLGRDFVRLLQNVARIPEFDLLWRDIILNPKSLCPMFTGVWQLLQIRTSRRFLQSRLTPEIERKLLFMTNNVKFGNHKRYQDWFQEKYFLTPESQSLRSDLIRFIINAIHPTNDMLCSDIIPRWAIIGWLLTSCTNVTALANAKLALFYDWLFFDPVKDNIMNVEPGILVMYHSIRNHPLVSSTLLDFLCRIMKNFYPKHEDKIRAGIFNSFRKILEKQVIPNLLPLFESPKLDGELRQMIRENFREFCSGLEPMDDKINTAYLMDEKIGITGGPFMMHNNNNIEMDNEDLESSNEPEVLFSDDEEEDSMDRKPNSINSKSKDGSTIVKDELTDDDDDLPLSKVRLKEKPMPSKVDLPASFGASFDKFIVTKSLADFEAFLTDFRTCSSLTENQDGYVVSQVVEQIKTSGPIILPESKNDDKLQESLLHPIFSLFKLFHQYEDKCKKCVQNMFTEVYKRVPGTGGWLLYFLKVHTKLVSRKNPNITFKTAVYKNICNWATPEDKLDKCLARDLTCLERENSQFFLWILPDIFREYKSHMINNCEVLKLLVGSIDAKNLRDLIYCVTQGKLQVFKQEGLVDCVRESFNYETFEQFCLWQLIQAHDVPIDVLQDILPELESSSHAEALTYMLLLLKNEKPTAELIRLLLSREIKSRGDPFVTSALRYWCQEHEEQLSEIIANLLISKYPNSSPNKRKRPLKNNSVPSTSPTSEQLLGHLEYFRRSCRHGNGTGTGLYVQDSMQRALQQAFSHSNDSTKKQYSDLFGLAAEDETSVVGRRGSSGRGRKQTPAKKDSNSSSSTNSGGTGSSKKNSEATVFGSSDDQSSSEDEWAKSKNAKRRKKDEDSN